MQYLLAQPVLPTNGFSMTEQKIYFLLLCTVTSRLSTQLDLEVALRTYAGGAYLTVLCPIARTVCVHGQYIDKCV